jgi:UDP-arabinose 4-epimerase
MNILVTGGAGYIGSHTCKALNQAGFVPIVFDNFSTGHRWAVRWGPLIEGDLENADLLRSALREYQIEAVIHFAASAYVGESMVNPRKYFHNNVINSINLLDVMMDMQVKTIVFSSTCATYGIPTRLPILEVHPQLPVNPYGDTKLFIEKAIKWYEKAYELNWITLRYFNAAGADPDCELGEMHDPETHLIPLAIQSALGQRSTLEIYGDDYPTTDGTAIRDYIHVTDLARAHVLALKYLIGGYKSSAFNLGTGQGSSIRAVVEMVNQVGQCKTPIHMTARRPGDPPALVADSKRALDLLNWAPEYSDLYRIVTTAWQWHQKKQG